MRAMLNNLNIKKQEILSKINNKKIEIFPKKRRKGFTLIEVIVTVGIIGILSSMAAISYSKAQDKAKKNIDYATAANIATAAQMAATNGESTITVQSLVSGGYLQSTPKVQQNSGGSFSVQISDDDKVTVKIGTETYYPKTETGN